MKLFEELKTCQSFPELALEKAIGGLIINPSKSSNPTLSPSGLGCQRAAAFKLSGAMVKEEQEVYESHLAADMGSFIHGRIQKFLSVSPIWVDVETFIQKRPELGLTLNPDQKHAGEISLIFSGKRGNLNLPPFTFQCDGIVLIDGEYYIVEIKTEGEIPWQNRTAPNPKHASQATGYAFLYGIPNILWVYASRESFGTHRKIYLQNIDERKIDEFVSTVTAIGRAVETSDINSLPKAKDCRYCGFVEECKKLRS